MFSHILKLKKESANKNDERVQQNVSQSINLNDKSFSMTNSSVKASQLTQKRPQPKQAPKRLKLKDYMRLNEISKQKRSHSAQLLRMESNKKLNKPFELNLRTTFGKTEVESSAKKNSYNYSEQISLQRFQLMKTVQKIRQKFNRIITLIQETTQKFSSYNDLVFMFRIEEVLNDYIKKGIHKITDSYKEYLISNPIEGINNEAIDFRLESMCSVRNIQSPQRQVLKVEDSIMEDKGTLEGKKPVNLSILPVSVSMQVSGQSNPPQNMSKKHTKKTIF